jgi:hypothetical protein
MRHVGISRKKLGISSGAENVGEKLGEFGPFVGKFRKNYLATLPLLEAVRRRGALSADRERAIFSRHVGPTDFFFVRVTS